MKVFCELALRAVIAEYEEDGHNNRNCLLEMLELALHYLDYHEIDLAIDHEID